MADSFNELFGLGSHSEDGNLLLFAPVQDDAASTAVDDVSSNGNDGTLVGAGNTEDSQASSGPNSYLTKALDLDGVNDNITGSGAACATTFSYGCWVKRVGTGSTEGIMSIGGQSSTAGPHIHFGSSTTLNIGIWGYGAAGTSVANSSTDWQFVGATLDSSDNHKIMVNGSFVATKTGVTLFSGTNGSYTGGSINGQAFDGEIEIAEMVIFDRDLSEAEWAQIYDGPEPINSVQPTISGTEQVGETLTCNPQTWVLDSPFGSGSNGTVTYSYQWTRSNDGSGTGEANISGATSSTYTPVEADEGKYLSCVVRASNDGGYDADADTATAYTGAIAAGGGGSTILTLMNHYLAG